MATIANLNVMLTASIGGFSSTIKGAASSLHSLGGVVGEISAKIFSLSGILTGVAGGAGLVLLVKNSMEGIAATGRLSDRMGIATEKLAGLQYASKLAGVGTEELTGGLEKMLKHLSEAATQGGPAAAALAQMGLDAKELANEAPDQAFSKIADGLKSIQNPAERARVVMELFGKTGQTLLPLFMEGSEGIKAAQAEAERLGLTFSRVDAAKVELANQSFTRLQGVLQGAAQTLAIQLAPFLEAAANKLTAFATSGKGAGQTIVNAFGGALSIIAKMADYLAVVEAGWQMLRAGASFAIGGILDGLGYVLDGLDWLLKKLGKTATGWGDSAHSLAKGFYATGKEAFAQAGHDWEEFANSTNSKAAARTIADIQAASQSAAESVAKDAAAMNGAGQSAEDWAAKLKLAEENAKKVTTTLEELHKQVATFGMSEGDKKIFDLKALGAGPEQIAEAQQAVDQLTSLENTKKATDLVTDLQKQIEQFGMTESQKKLADLKLPGVSEESLAKAQELVGKLDALNAAKKKMEEQTHEAKSIFDATRTPMEKYEQQITKLSDLLNAGAIDWDTYGRAVRQARQQLEDAAKAQSPELIQAGTAQAQRYAYDQSHGNQQMNLGRDETAKLQYTEQFQSRLILQRIENGLKDQAASTETVVDI